MHERNGSPSQVELPTVSIEDLTDFGNFCMLNNYSGFDDSELVGRLANVDSRALADLVVNAFAELNEKDELPVATSLFANRAVDTLIRIKSGDEGPEISEKQEEERKKFALGMIEAVRDYADNNSMESAERLAEKVESVFVEGSNAIVDYIGNVEDELEVAMAAQAVPQLKHTASRAALSAMFGLQEGLRSTEKINLFVEKVRQADKSPVRQLEWLKFYDMAAEQWFTNDPYGEVGDMRFNTVFNALAKESNALTGLVASHYEELTHVRMAKLMSPLESPLLSPEQKEIVKDHMAKDLREKGFSDISIAEAFGQTDDDVIRDVQLSEELQAYGYPVRTSEDTIGIRDRYGIVRRILPLEVADTMAEPLSDGAKINHGIAVLNRESSLSTYEAAGGDKDKERLLQAVHEPSIKRILETSIGVDLAEIPLQTQFQLLDYMVHRTPEEFARLSNAAKKFEATEGSTKKFYEAFLATEFGDDFGDTLLALAENLPSNEVSSLLEKVQRIREYGARYARRFEGFDDAIVAELQSSIAERVTEALCVAESIALSEDGIATKRVMGRRLTAQGLHEAHNALSIIATAFERNDKAEESGIITPAYEDGKRGGWHLGENKGVLIQSKSEGDSRGEHLSGVEFSEEGQYNTLVDVLSEEGEEIPLEIADHRRRYALSIRLDLSGVLRDINGGKIGFDATKNQLNAELDFGSLRAAEDNPNYRVAKIISLGRKIRDAKLGKGRSRGYHTSLPPKYGERRTFRELVEFRTRPYYRRLLGRAVLGQLPDLPLSQSSVSQSEIAAA